MARLWFVKGEDMLARADQRITRDFTPAERDKYHDLLEAVSEGKR